MPRTPGVPGIGAVLTFALAIGSAAGPDPLAAHRWTARVLVIASPNASDPRLRAQREAVAEVRAGFDDRDLVVVEAVGQSAEAAALRRRLGLPDGEFRSVLVGKDGKAKITASQPIEAQRLFATIDAMPMRRQEMRSRRAE